MLAWQVGAAEVHDAPPANLDRKSHSIYKVWETNYENSGFVLA